MISKIILLSFSLFLLTACSKKNYLEIHKSALVVDGHNDTLGRIVDQGFNLGDSLDHGHINFETLKTGGLDIPFFACWVDPKYLTAGENGEDLSTERVDAMIDGLLSQVNKYPDQIALAKTVQEARDIVRSGKIAAALGIEGGHAIENDLKTLERFYERGVRYMTLTWNNSLDWATSAMDESSDKELPFRGLTDFGRQVVKKMNELGMMVDISHVGEQTFWDVMETTTKPVIASHSSVSYLSPHFRNLKDDQIRAVAKNKGVVLINFYAGFLDSTYERKRDQFVKTHKAELDSLRKNNQNHLVEYLRSVRKVFGAELDAIRPPMDIILDHIIYIIKLVGVDYVGLGSDFDGISAPPVGMENASYLPAITKGLLEKGYSENDIKKILGENFLRVWQANEKQSQEL
jgi:membrane dipeptidase